MPAKVSTVSSSVVPCPPDIMAIIDGFSIIGVRTLPGWMELHRTLEKPSSPARALARPRTPHFEVA